MMVVVGDVVVAVTRSVTGDKMFIPGNKTAIVDDFNPSQGNRWPGATEHYPGGLEMPPHFRY